jgi:hypothetical protein
MIREQALSANKPHNENRISSSRSPDAVSANREEATPLRIAVAKSHLIHDQIVNG